MQETSRLLWTGTVIRIFTIWYRQKKCLQVFYWWSMDTPHFMTTDSFIIDILYWYLAGTTFSSTFVSSNNFVHHSWTTHITRSAWNSVLLVPVTNQDKMQYNNDIVKYNLILPIYSTTVVLQTFLFNIWFLETIHMDTNFVHFAFSNANSHHGYMSLHRWGCVWVVHVCKVLYKQWISRKEKYDRNTATQFSPLQVNTQLVTKLTAQNLGVSVISLIN